MLGEETNSRDEGIVTLGELGQFLRRNSRMLIIGALLGLFAGWLVLSQRAPSYRVKATLLLDTRQSPGVLGELVALTSAPVVVSEMEILRSRSIAEAVVTGDPGCSGRALTTLVESDRRTPVKSLIARVTHGRRQDQGTDALLRAELIPDPRTGARPVLQLEFIGPGRVRLSKERMLSRLGFGGEDLLETDFTPGERLEYDGLGLVLYPTRELTGESFTVRSLSFEDAVERVMEQTRIAETARKSGVMEVTYDDSDPHRAAATANALCEIYLERNQQRSEKRASRTVEFIQEQLEEQLESLHQAELEVVALQQESPQLVDLGTTGQALITELSSLEVQRIRVRMLRTGVEETLALLKEGELAALSHMGPDVPDPIAQNYIAQIAQLTTEAELLERTDSGIFKGMVQAQGLQLRAEVEALEVKVGTLHHTIAELERGNTAILGTLVSMEEPGEQDPLLWAYVEKWTSIDSRLRELRVGYTDELPEIGELEEEITGIEKRVLVFLQGRLAGFETQHREFQELLAGYGEQVGDYPGLEREKIAKAVASMRLLTADHLTSRLAGLESRLAGIEEERQRIEAKLARLPEEERHLADPRRRLEAHSEIVKFLLSQQKEAEISKAGTTATAEFIDTAVPPREPRGPSIPRHLMVGLVLGLGATLALAFARQAIDRGIFTLSELEAASGLPVFGAIPDYRRGPCKIRRVGPDFVALRDDPEGIIAEAYRSVRANLKFVLNSGQPGGEIKTLAFTSCTPGEGKSVTNVDMALAFALAGRRVLLVDADLRRPAVSRYLRTSTGPGLSNILEGRVAWRDCVQAEVLPGLDVIPSGHHPASPADLFAGDLTNRFLDDVRDAYDLVVFDVPPVLAVSDIEGLAAKLDAVLLVCRSAKLSHTVVNEGVRRLQQVGARLLGAVLNASRPSHREQKYGYGYGHNYGYGAKEKNAA